MNKNLLLLLSVVTLSTLPGCLGKKCSKGEETTSCCTHEETTKAVDTDAKEVVEITTPEEENLTTEIAE